MKREPFVAGEFYPDSAESLRKMIDTLVEKTPRPRSVIGVVSPHAGYTYSGGVAGAVFSRIIIPDCIIIMGPNHTSAGRPFSLMASGSWITPMGEVAIDEGLASDLLNRSRYLQDDVTAHSFEHSIEVQLPFLQYFNQHFSIVPIILAGGELEVYKEIGWSISESLMRLKRNVLLVASTDMTHYEPQKTAKAKDEQAINAILNLDENALLKRVKEMEISMCGYVPTIVMLVIAKALGAQRAELVKYATSGDASGDLSSVVGYAGIIIS